MSVTHSGSWGGRDGRAPRKTSSAEFDPAPVPTRPAALGIEAAAAAQRYVRAIRRLRDVLGAMPGGEGV